MNIFVFIPQLIFGGAEKVLVSFANDLVSRGHQVHVVELHEKGLLKDQFDSRVTFDAVCSREYTRKYYASLSQVREKPWLVYKLAFSKLVGYLRFAEFLARKRYAGQHYDVAINYLETVSPEFLINSISAGKYLQWYHTDVGNLDHPEETDRMIPLYEKMDGIICVAETAKKSFVERYPQLKDKTHVIYNFFDCDAIKRLGNVPFSFGLEKPVLLSVGRMTPPKKYLRFLDVLARIRDDGIIFSWHVLGDGYLKEDIQKKICDLGLQEHVFLDGLTDNPYRYMKNCDLFVLPSGWEGFPTVTIEAKVLECPVLATDVSGIREQMEHGKNGWIVENDEEAIYEGLKYLLLNPDVMQKLKSNEGMEPLLDNEEKYRMVMRVRDDNDKGT